ncbi:MAG: GDP-mannose 4,6-dehydratase [Candidatus Riflebacteria bacterium]|nr:GDP-mannose 4,6-dehydratase [Candidatus Riflebacteria bacterium]
MKAIIFGAGGQDGFYFSEICKERNLEPVLVSRSKGFINGDISSFSFVESLIKTHCPSYIFHLAANSTTKHDSIFDNHQTISTGTLNILEAVKRHKSDAKVFITGSGLQFVNIGKPISENDQFEARDAYSISRIQSAYAARYYRSIGIKAYVGYLFHHESPYRKSRHISKIIAHFVEEIAMGSNEKLRLGNIDVEKEWTFAGDVVRAIFTLVDQDKIFEATIGSGVAYPIRSWLEECFLIAGKNWKDHVLLQEGFRPEYMRLISNPSTIKSLGWSPKISLSELASMMVSLKKGDNPSGS